MVFLLKLIHKFNIVSVKQKYCLVWFGLMLDLDNLVMKFTWKGNFEKSLEKALRKNNNEK